MRRRKQGDILLTEPAREGKGAHGDRNPGLRTKRKMRVKMKAVCRVISGECVEKGKEDREYLILRAFGNLGNRDDPGFGYK